MQPEKVEARNGGNRPSLVNANDVEARYTTRLSPAQQILRLTDDLAAIAYWKRELQFRIRIAELKFECIDCMDRTELDSLAAEFEVFREVCARLCESMDCNSERKAQ